MGLSRNLADQRHSFRSCCAGERLIKGCEREGFPQSQFEMSGIVDRQPAPSSQGYEGHFVGKTTHHYLETRYVAKEPRGSLYRR